MNIGLIDVDSHNFPNLALMKLSAYHKAKGDNVEWWNGLKTYDVVYQSKVFDDTYSQDIEYCINADEIIKGGTGYDLKNVLPDEVEHIYPDYTIYSGGGTTAYGFLTRGCPRHCPFCIVSEKEGNTHTVADIGEFWKDQKYIELLDANILASKDREKHLLSLADTGAYVDFNQGLDVRLMDRDTAALIGNIKLKDIHFAWDNPGDQATIDGLELYAKYSQKKIHGSYATVYVLTNFGSTHEQDLERIYRLREMGYDPYVMIYDKPSAPKITKRLQRWCNNRYIFKSCENFEDYKI